MDDLNAAVEQEGKTIETIESVEDLQNDIEKDTSTESATEQSQTEETPSSEGDTTAATSTEQDGGNTQDVTNKPFHEDPKIQDYINRQLEKRLAEESSKLESNLADKFSPKEETTTIPVWFGGDEAQWKAYQADQARIVEEAKERAIREIETRTQAEQAKVKEAQDWFEQSVSELESTGAKVDRNKLLKFVADNELVDSKGRWNYKAGYQFMAAQEQLKAKPDLTDKKRLAASTTSNNKAEDKPKDYKTPDDFKGRGWYDYSR
jgi:hypothetical protein